MSIQSICLFIAISFGFPAQSATQIRHESTSSANPLRNAEADPKDIHAIKLLIGNTYDTADTKVKTEPVVISNNYAIADWVQGEKGGRALLKKGQSNWKIILCGGGGLKLESTLHTAGIPAATAKLLAHQLALAEKSLSASQVKLLDSFGAIIHFDQHHAPSKSSTESSATAPQVHHNNH